MRWMKAEVGLRPSFERLLAELVLETLREVPVLNRCTQGRLRMALELWLFSTGIHLAHSIRSQTLRSIGTALVREIFLLDLYHMALHSN